MKKRLLLISILIAVLLFTWSYVSAGGNGGIFSPQRANAADNSRVIDNGDGTFTYKNKWLCSYETLLFDTKDGDLDIGDYAPDESGIGYYYRAKPKNEAQFDWTDNVSLIKGLHKVKIVAGGHAYYDEFLTSNGASKLWDSKSQYYMADPSQLPSGSVLRVQSNAKKYWDTAWIKDYPQPEKTEIVIEIPPDEPLPEKPEHHSIALDVASNSGGKSSVSSYSWSHTCTGSNLLLVVGDAHWSSTNNRTVTGITYNSDSLTFIRTDENSDIYFFRSTLYYRVAPDTGGAYTVAVTLSGTMSNGAGGAVSYTGAKQTGQPDAHNGANAYTGKTQSTTVTTVADNSWVAGVLVVVSHPTCGNTQRWNVNSGYYWAGSDTNAPKTPAGSQTMSWTQASNAIWAISAASFAPAVAAAPTISVTPTSKAWGTIALGNTSATTINAFTLTNTGDCAVDVTIQGTDFTGGDDTWDLSDNASVGDNIYGLKAGLDDADDLFDITIGEASATAFISNLGVSGNQSWGLKIYMPSAVTGYDRQSMTATITLVCSAH